MDELSTFLALHQPSILQDLQMLRDRRLTHVEPGSDLARREVYLRQVSENFPPWRRGQSFEDLVHSLRQLTNELSIVNAE